MDWLTFIAEIAWPLVVVGAIIYFRKPLGELLSSLKKFNIGPIGIETEATKKPTDEDAIKLEAILKTGAHSFKWLRSKGFTLSDEQFEKVIASNSNKLQKTSIRFINSEGDIVEERPGVKLIE